MQRCLRIITDTLARDTARLAATLVLLPVLVLGPLSAEEMLIHNHRGHDIHSHRLRLCELDDWRNNLEHRHEEHGHDGQPADAPEDDNGTVVIVFDLPDAFLRVRGLSTGTVAVAGPASSAQPISACQMADSSNGSLRERPSLPAHNLRASRIVAGILLSNHALLL